MRRKGAPRARRTITNAALMIVQRMYHLANDPREKGDVLAQIAAAVGILPENVDDWIVGESTIPQHRALTIVSHFGNEAEKARWIPSAVSPSIASAGNQRGTHTIALWAVINRLEKVAERLEQQLAAQNQPEETPAQIS